MFPHKHHAFILAHFVLDHVYRSQPKIYPPSQNARHFSTNHSTSIPRHVKLVTVNTPTNNHNVPLTIHIHGPNTVQSKQGLLMCKSHGSNVDQASPYFFGLCWNTLPLATTHRYIICTVNVYVAHICNIYTCTYV